MGCGKSNFRGRVCQYPCSTTVVDARVGVPQATTVDTPTRKMYVNVFRANAIVCVALIVVCCSLVNRESAKYPFVASYSTVGSEDAQCYCAMRFIVDEYARVGGNRRWI